MFSRVSAQGKLLSEKVDKATAAHLTHPIHDLNNELTNQAVADKKAAYWIIKHLRHKLWSRDQMCAINAIHVFKTLMSSSHANVYYQMNRKGIQEFAKLYFEKIKDTKKRGGLSEQDKLLLRLVLQCIEDWYKQVKSLKDCGEFSQVYKNMMSKGVRFPSQVKILKQNDMPPPPLRARNIVAAPRPVLQRPTSSTGIQYRIHAPTPFYAQPNAQAMVRGIQGPQPGAYLDAVFEENGWVLLEAGMYIPIIDPNSGILIAEALPYQEPKSPKPKEKPKPAADVEIDSNAENLYGDSWIEKKFPLEMKRIINVVDLAQEMLLEPSMSLEQSIMNEALQLMIVDLKSISAQLQEIMETVTEPLVLEYVFAIKSDVDDTLKIQESRYGSGPGPVNARVDKTALLNRLQEIEDTLTSQKDQLVVKKQSDEGELSHDEMDSDSDPFGLKKFAETKGNKQNGDDFDLNIDPFAAATADASDPFASTADPFLNTVSPSDPFSSPAPAPSSQNKVDDLLSAAFAPKPAADPFNTEPPKDIFGFSSPSQDPFQNDPFATPPVQTTPAKSSLDHFSINYKEPEPGTPEADAVDSILPAHDVAAAPKKEPSSDFFSKTGASTPVYEDPFASVIGENSDFHETSKIEEPPGVVAPMNPSPIGPAPINPNPTGFFNPHSMGMPPINPNASLVTAPVNPNPFAPPPNMFSQPTGNPFSDPQPDANPFATPNTTSANPFATPTSAAEMNTKANPFQDSTKAEKKDPFASLGDPFADFMQQPKIQRSDHAC